MLFGGCGRPASEPGYSGRPHPDMTLLSYGGVPGKDLIEAWPLGTAKVGPDERGDDVTRAPGDVVDCLRAGTVAQQAAPRVGQVRLSVREALMDAAPDDDDIATLLQPTHQLIADLQVVILLLGVALQPQEGPIKAGTGQGVRQRAVDVDADLEARIGADHLNGGGAAERVAEHADVLHIQVPGQRRRGFAASQLGELVEDEAAVGSPDVTHLGHAGAEEAGLAALTD